MSRRSSRVPKDRSIPMYKVWFPMHEEEETAREIGALDVPRAAENHADYCYRHQDGYEWKWPLTCLVVEPDGTRWAVSVEARLEPTFYTSPEKSIDDMEPAVHCAYDTGARCGDVRLDVGNVKFWPTGQGHVTFDAAVKDPAIRKQLTCETCAKSVENHIRFMADIDERGQKLMAERHPDKPECPNNSPPWFKGRWRDWHRGHGCNKDDGNPRTPEGQAEIDAGGGA